MRAQAPEASEETMTDLGRARAATLAVFFVNGLGIGAWSAAIPAIKVAFALSDGRLSLVLLAFAGGAVLFMPIGGAVAPRWGLRRRRRRGGSRCRSAANAARRNIRRATCALFV